MKLLIVTPRFPYPVEKGDKLRIFHQIRELSRYHKIVLCAITEKKVRENDLKIMEQYCTSIYKLSRSNLLIFKNLAKSFLKKQPLQVGYFFDENLKKELHSIIAKEQPDHLYCQLFRTAEYIRELRIPKTIDYMDAFSTIAIRWAQHASFPMNWILEREARKIAAYETAIFPDFDHHLIISDRDRSLLPIKKKKEIHVVPNGVDLDFFQPNPSIKKKYDLAFVGNMGYPPNVKAAQYLVQNILPELLKILPNIRVLIAGARPTNDVQKLKGPNVHVAGWVEDIRDAYASAEVFVAPIFMGSGLQNKILEAMAMGVPCIVSTQVNYAIDAKPKESIFVANEAEDFVNHILNLLSDKGLRAKTSQAGLAFVQANFSWARFGKQLSEVFLSKKSNADF